MSQQFVDFILRVKDQMSAGLKKASSNFQSMGDTAKIAAGILIRDMVQGAASAVSEITSLTGKLETVRTSFDRLLAASGATGQSFENLKASTGGLIADVDLLTAANQAMSLGLPVDELDELYDASIRVGAAQGMTATQSINDFTIAIGRQSTKILDNFGIILKQEKAYEEYAAMIGKSTDELTESEKETAFATVAIKKLKDQAGIVGDTISNTQKAQMKWNASIKNLKTSIGGLLAPLGAITPMLSQMIVPLSTIGPTMIKSMGGWSNILGKASGGVANLASMLPGLATKTGLVSAAQAVLNAVMNANPILLVITAIGALVGILAVAYAKYEPFRKAVNQAGEVLRDVFAAALERVQGAIKWVVDVLKILWNVFNDLPAPIQFLINPLAAVIANFDKIAEAAKIVGGALQKVAGAFGWVAGKIGGFVANVAQNVAKWTAEVKQATTDQTDTVRQAYQQQVDAVKQGMNEKINVLRSEMEAELQAVEEHYAALVEEEQARWEEAKKTAVEAWLDKIDTTKEGFDKVYAEYNQHFDQQVEKVKSALDSEVQTVKDKYNEELDTVKTHFSEMLEQVEDSYEQRRTSMVESFDQEITQLQQATLTELGIQQEYVDSVTRAIDQYTQERLRAVTEEYDQERNATNQFYNEMLAVHSERLDDIRENRQKDLENLELTHLLKQEALETALEKGTITQEEYENQITELNKKYREERSEISDEYRIQELEAKKAQREAEEGIETERAEKLKEISEKEASDKAQVRDEMAAKEEEYRNKVQQLQSEKQAKLEEMDEAHKQRVEQIQTEKREAIEAIEDKLAQTVETLKRESQQEIEKIEEERKATLEQIRQEEQQLEQKHEENVKQLKLDKATEKQTIEEDYNEQIQTTREKAQDRISRLQETWLANQKSSFTDAWDGIVKGAQKFGGDLTGAFNNMKESVSNAWGNMVSGVTSAWEGAVESVTGGAEWLWEKLTGGSIWLDLCNDMEDSWRNTMSILPKEAEEGMNAVKQTVEAVTPQAGIGTPAGAAGLTPVTPGSMRTGNVVSLRLNGPLVQVEGSLNREVLREAERRTKQMLESVISEASSTGAASTHKRIRTQSKLQGR